MREHRSNSFRWLCHLCWALQWLVLFSGKDSQTTTISIVAAVVPPPPPPNQNSNIHQGVPSSSLSSSSTYSSAPSRSSLLEDSDSGSDPDTDENDDDNDNNNDDDDDDGKSSVGFLQIVETELWDVSSNLWRAAGAIRESTITPPTQSLPQPAASAGAAQAERWTDEQGRTSLSPSELSPPEGFAFEGDWKIVVQTGRDGLGWEYQFRYLQPPTRRRIWLRQLQQARPRGIVDPTTSTTTKTTTTTPTNSVQPQQQQLTQQRTKKQKKPFSSQLLQRIKEDYNFKGFGISFCKSLLAWDSLGLHIFCPLSMNFDWCDRHPEFPSLSTSWMVWYPWSIGQFLSLSVNVEWVKWIFARTLLTLRWLMWMVCYQGILRGVVLLGAVSLYPFVGRKLYTLPPLPRHIQSSLSSSTLEKPDYNSEISERIGFAWSYRWSQGGGMEHRFGYFHSYQPTLTVYQNIGSSIHPRRLVPSWLVPGVRRRRGSGQSLASSLTKMESDSTNNYNNNKNQQIGWWRSHFARIGTSTAIPMPDPPYFSCNAVLALTGFYFRPPTTTTSTATTATTTGSDRYQDDPTSLENSSSSSSNNNNMGTDADPPEATASEAEWVTTTTKMDNQQHVVEKPENEHRASSSSLSSSRLAPKSLSI